MENCNKYQERISAFIDGLLPEEERLELMEHMADCPACQAYFDDQIAIHAALTGLEADAPEGFTDAVMARVRETAQESAVRKTTVFPHWRRWAATAACCALAVLGVMTLGGDHSAPAVSQSVTGYTLSRTEEASVTSSNSTAAPAAQTESVPTDEIAACSLADDADLSPQPASTPLADEARTEADKKITEAAAASCTLTTSSPLATQWVMEQLDQSWQTGSSYALTQVQFDELRALLDDAGEPYTTETNESGSFLLLAAA